MAKVKNIRKINIPIIVAGILFYLTVVSVCITSGLYARYTVSDSSSDTARVAIMASDVTLTVDDNIPTHPGHSVVIPVTIANYEGTKVCEVAQRYTLSARALEDNIPYEINIYNDAECSSVASETDLTGTFKPAEEQFENYYIKVTWPANINASYYAFEIDAIEIVVDVEQID